jgi:hypothetical protein
MSLISTVPFIARYRKELTGNLDEVQIRTIAENLLYFRELDARKATILASRLSAPPDPEWSGFQWPFASVT